MAGRRPAGGPAGPLVLPAGVAPAQKHRNCAASAPHGAQAMTEFSLKDPSSIGVAFLGVGRMGQTHIQTLAGIRNVRLEVVADADPSAAERGREIARAGRATTDPLDAINDPAVEAVVIATPTTTHASLIEA